MDKYFKKGDIVTAINDSIWEGKLFKIHNFSGNAYSRLVVTYFNGREEKISNMCIFTIKDIKLINSSKRPFKKISKNKLLILMKKNVIEAKREFLIRINKSKKYV